MRAELRDGLEFLFADSQIGKRPTDSIRLETARNAKASFQVLINEAPLGKRLNASLSCNGKPCKDVEIFRLIDVPVEKNTGPVGFIEREGETNPYVIRRAPFRVFDAMEPVGKSVKVLSPVKALRVQIPVSDRTRPGVQNYVLELAVGKDKILLKVSLRVHKACVTPVGRDSLPYTNWFSAAHIAGRHGLQPWTDRHWAMIGRYAKAMARGRQNTFWMPLSVIFDVKRGKPVLNRDRLHRWVRLFTREGMYYIEGGHVAHRTGGDWNAETFDLTLSGIRATTPEGNAFLHQICSQLMAEIDAKGWRDRWIQHVTDEPTTGNAADYRILAGMVRRHMPGIPLMDATMELSLAGAVDIWCPQVQEYERHKKAFEGQRALGDRIWFYTCCFPGGPWLNRLLDMELLRPCYFGWAAALHDLHGFLHWGLNHYKEKQDPFQESVVDHGNNNFLPAGDTHIVYPGPRGPWSSVRLEAQREGLEDYELLKSLKERKPKEASAILRKVIRGFDRYAKRTETYRKAKADMLRAASRIRQG